MMTAMTDQPPAPIKGAALFRPAALERLSVTEDLDRPAELAGGRHLGALLALAALVLLMSAAVLVLA